MTPERLRFAIRLGVYSLVLITPLPFGSVQAAWVLGIELMAMALGLAALAVIHSDSATRDLFPRAPIAFASTIIAVGLFQLAPVPLELADRFVPTARFVRALAPYLGGDAAVSVTWSVASAETIDALFRFIAYVLIGVSAAIGFDEARTRRQLAMAIVGAAAFQAIYGVGEYLTGRQHIFGFAKKHYLDSATGTFINRNHFACFLALAMPFALTLALRAEPMPPAQGNWRIRVLSVLRNTTFARVFGAASAATLWVGLLLSRSRTGLLVGLSGAAIVFVGFRSARAARWTVAFALLVLALLLSSELRQIPGDRFLAARADLLGKGGRVSVWRDSLSLVRERPLMGWGLGTFETAFQRVQSAEVESRYDHAHNEWLQFIVEGGVITLGLAVALVAWCLSVRDRGVWLLSPSSRHGDLLIASTSAIAVAAADFLFEFSGRIPAVAVLCAAVFGLQLSLAISDRLRPQSTECSTLPFPTVGDAMFRRDV